MGQTLERIRPISATDGVLTNVAVLIPAYNPDSKLSEFVAQLLDRGFGAVLVVNDGSDQRCDSVFQDIAATSGCTVLEHVVNLGKGRALKTGFNHFLLHYPAFVGLVTADADGQHAPDDTESVARKLASNLQYLILGARRFEKDVPLRSRVGNALTRWLFAFLVGKKISDTQTGLRGLSRDLCARELQIDGERYEYEMNMLMAARTQARGILEQPIKTIYIAGNESSHFNPLTDSLKIYFVLFRFLLSSLLAGATDLVIFAITYRSTGNLTLSLLLGRVVIGSLINFSLNKRFVFHSHASIFGPLIKYYMLFCVNALISYLCIQSLHARYGINVISAKVMVESLLFIASFSIQRSLIFSSRQDEKLAGGAQVGG
jgi:glycosyltransferase involved in cell wall biosynthesis